MVEKPANQDLSQAYTGLLSGAALDSIYEKMIDMTLVEFGRDVTLHLQPATSLPDVNADTYNDATGGFDPRLDDADTGNKGVEITPITVTYRAHIKHGPVEYKEGLPFILNANQVSITTVYGAWEDILDAVEVEIDGNRFLLDSGPRAIGFATKKYIISIWRRKADGI